MLVDGDDHAVLDVQVTLREIVYLLIHRHDLAAPDDKLTRCGDDVAPQGHRYPPTEPSRRPPPAEPSFTVGDHVSATPSSTAQAACGTFRRSRSRRAKIPQESSELGRDIEPDRIALSLVFSNEIMLPGGAQL